MDDKSRDSGPDDRHELARLAELLAMLRTRRKRHDLTAEEYDEVERAIIDAVPSFARLGGKVGCEMNIAISDSQLRSCDAPARWLVTWNDLPLGRGKGQAFCFKDATNRRWRHDLDLDRAEGGRPLSTDDVLRLPYLRRQEADGKLFCIAPYPYTGSGRCGLPATWVIERSESPQFPSGEGLCGKHGEASPRGGELTVRPTRRDG